MARRRNRQDEAFIRSALQNTWTYKDYEDMLTEMALSRFEWENLPDSCDERYLERALFYNGQAIFVRDDVLGELLSLKVTLGGKFDVYGIPVERTAYGSNEYQIQCSQLDSVLVYNNYKRQPTYPIVKNYAMRLYEIDRTIDVNVGAQKTPVLILCDENERLTMENIYTQYEGNRPVIFGKKGLNTDALTVLKTDAPYVSDKLYNLKVNIFNEALTVLGIANVSIEKRERLVSDEVSKALGGTISNRYAYIEMRQQAADKVNKMFGTDIQVKFRDGESDEDTATATVEDTITEQEGSDDE